MRVFLFVLTALLATQVVYSSNDSIQHTESDTLTQVYCPVVKKSWFAVPIVFYQEETSAGIGASGGYYFKSQNLKKISSISGSIIYTFLNQAKININPRFYTPKEKFYFTGNLNLRYYPELFFGIGNDALDESVKYTSEAFSLNFQPFYAVTPSFYVGLYLSCLGEKLKLNEETEKKRPELIEKYGEAGWDPYFMWAFGAQLMYDTRDNQFYPQKFSNFIKLSASTNLKALGSSYDVTSLTLDIRQYIPTWVGQVFAWQIYADARFGKEIPFRMLPALGGSENLRGFRERKFTDNFMFEFQAEYRIPIWWRLKAAVFCSVGDVIDIYDSHIQKIKVGYGLGLRCRLNDARVHLRVDVAGNNYGEFKFYITATEAF